jgi:radical SAM-linked protein
MPRILFEKKGNAVWISHLDLMRLFQRAFKRSGLALTHTQGFNPRPSVSIALPLSVGVESDCEMLDFDLDGDKVANRIVRGKLNDYLLPGIRVIKVYDNGQKLKNLALLDTVVTLEYDNGVPENCVDALKELFSREEVLVEKKTKSNGIQDQNIIPMISSIEIEKTDDHTVEMKARICCQNPTLNPMQLHAAIVRHLPELTPNFAKCQRLEVYDNEGNIFR